MFKEIVGYTYAFESRSLRLGSVNSEKFDENCLVPPGEATREARGAQQDEKFLCSSVLNEGLSLTYLSTIYS